MELTLNTFGVALSLDNEGFVICGPDGTERIPPSGIDTIRLSKGIQITSDAILFAIKNEIEILFSDRTGQPQGRVWSPRYGSISTIRKGQLAFVRSSDAIIWIKAQLIKKIENQQALLRLMKTNCETGRRYYDLCSSKLEGYKERIVILEGLAISDVASQLRGFEGVCSKKYFEAFSRAIPSSYYFEGRSQHPATNPANALLNYGYGILYGKVEGALISAGIDPYIGVLHRDEYNHPVLAFDFIEPYRLWVDYVVYNILIQNIVTEDYYSVREDGSVWLENLGRRVIIQRMNDYLQEIVNINNKERSRATHLALNAQRFAQTLKQYCRSDCI